MNTSFICPSNVTQVAKLILELDSVAIDERYYQDSASAFLQLKALLDKYAHVPLREVNIGRLEAQLAALIACVKECMALLTHEARQQVSDCLQLITMQSEKLKTHQNKFYITQ
jgi:hypothetical protein